MLVPFVMIAAAEVEGEKRLTFLLIELATPFDDDTHIHGSIDRLWTDSSRQSINILGMLCGHCTSMFKALLHLSRQKKKRQNVPLLLAIPHLPPYHHHLLHLRVPTGF